ncbi:MAG: hypothetical protein LBK94_05230 [Prevotellaceae bacterium]|nr:hypothetical protein [Prevotellaceae bacterium]
MSNTEKKAGKVKHSSQTSTQAERNAAGNRGKITYGTAKIDVMLKSAQGACVIGRYSIEYVTEAELFRGIFDYFGTQERFSVDGIELLVRTESSRFYWRHDLAHSCFAHGAISTDRCIEMMLDSNEKMKEAAV